MNGITKQAIHEALQKYGGKSAASKYVSSSGAYYEFSAMVEAAWWNHLLLEKGWAFKERAVHLWRLFHPEHFTDDGEWFQDRFDNLYDLDIKLSEIALRILHRWLARNPGHSLDTGGMLEHVNAVINPQLTLF